MAEDKSQTQDFDWHLTSFEGSRREQLRRWAQLPLENILRAVEEMADTSQRLQSMRAHSRLQTPVGQTAKAKPQPPRKSEIREPQHVYKGESPVHTITLHGCTPEPLMSYLKALGVLRLVSQDTEHGDPGATGFWMNDRFVLQSSLIQAQNDPENLVNFFLAKYKPTPILAPWNAGCGFYKKWDPKKNAFKSRDVADALERVEKSSSAVFAPYRKQISRTKQALERHATRVDVKAKVDSIREKGVKEGWSAKKIKDEINGYLNGTLLFEVGEREVEIEKAGKDEFVRIMRSEVLGDRALWWFDAALVLLTGRDKNRVEAPVLGSGGNIGNSDFSGRFIQLLGQVLPLNDGEPVPKHSESLLRSALLGKTVSDLVSFAVDQFDPGKAGGANMGQGMIGDYSLNPWNYILMIEGALLLVGAATRRLNANRNGSAFPFSVDDDSATGFASGGRDQTRGELWLPLWDRPCSPHELAALFGEGRAEIGRRRPRNGVDFARAVASLGVDRGVSEFVRIQFQKRLGDNYLATTVGRFRVTVRENVNLLQEIDEWLNRFRSACKVGQKGEAPARLIDALRRIEGAIFDYCRYGGQRQFQAILIALGWAERELMRDGSWAEKYRVRPLHGLSADWIEASYDASPEFNLALALAGISDGGDVGPLRANLEPVRIALRKDGGIFASWAEKDRTAVWNRADVAGNLAAVLVRRIQDAARKGKSRLPLWSPYTVSLDSIAAYLANQTDDKRLEELLWGLVLIDHRRTKRATNTSMPEVLDAPPLSRLYALLKPLFLSGPIVCHAGHWRFARKDAGITIRPEPRILSLLRAGRTDEAARIATQRLRASGLRPMVTHEERTWPVVQGRRLASALLFPIDSYSLDRLLRSVVRQDSTAIQLQGEVA